MGVYKLWMIEGVAVVRQREGAVMVVFWYRGGGIKKPQLSGWTWALGRLRSQTVAWAGGVIEPCLSGGCDNDPLHGTAGKVGDSQIVLRCESVSFCAILCLAGASLYQVLWYKYPWGRGNFFALCPSATLEMLPRQ